MAVLAFAIDALTMSALMFALALALASAQERLISRLRASTHQVKVWGGRILILVGLWLLILAAWADFFARSIRP